MYFPGSEHQRKRKICKSGKEIGKPNFDLCSICEVARPRTLPLMECPLRVAVEKQDLGASVLAISWVNRRLCEILLRRRRQIRLPQWLAGRQLAPDQVGSDSDHDDALGLKKKSEHKTPTRKKTEPKPPY